MPIIRATTIDGKWIQAAQWIVKSVGDLHQDHKFQIALPIKSKPLAAYASKLSQKGVQLETVSNRTYVNLDFTIVSVRHMLDVERKEAELESMAMIVPLNRTVEDIFLYIVNIDICNPRFVEAIKKAS